MADHFQEILGTWQIDGGRYGAIPAGLGQTTVSLLETIAPLPSNFEIGVTLNSPAGVGGLYSNAMLIVDYRHANDYKYVGAFTGVGKWRFGRYLNGSFLEQLILPDPNLAPGTDFVVDLLVEGSAVSAPSTMRAPQASSPWARPKELRTAT